MIVYFYLDLSHVLDRAAGPCGNKEDVRPAVRTRSNRCSKLQTLHLEMTTFLSQSHSLSSKL